MPLVNAEDHEYDAAHYATTFSNTVGGTCAVDGDVTPDANGNATINVKCDTLTGLGIKSINNQVGYYLEVKATMTSLLAGDVTGIADGSLNGIALTDSRVYDGTTNLLMNVKLDEAKLFEARNLVQNVAKFTLTLKDKTTEKTYTATYNISVDYKGAATADNVPGTSKFYLVEVTKANGSKEYAYVPYKSANDTLKDLNLGKYGSKFSVVDGDGKVGEAEYAATSTIKISDLQSDIATKGVLRLKVVSASTVEPEKEPEATEPGSSTTKPADKDKDSTPKTGNTDLMGFVPLMTLLSLVGIVTLKKTI